ncbi:HAD family hydrolase [Albidovulum sp.]
MTIRAVAWDIDGTLVDSEPVHLLALEATCAEVGADISDLPGDRFIGVHVHDVWRALRPRMPARVDRRTFLDRINSHYLDLADRLQPMPHALTVVAELARFGLRQVAVSNSPRAVVNANLALAGLERHFEFSLSLDDVTAGKPDPEPYLVATRRLGLSPTRIVAIEDSDAGARSARAAGLSLIRLDWGDAGSAPKMDELKRAGEHILHMARIGACPD